MWSDVIDVPVRSDLVSAQTLAWESIATPGSWWSGEQRLAIASVTIDALEDRDPPPAWVPVSTIAGRSLPTTIPAVAADTAHRLARSPGTLSADWYDSVVGGEMSALAHVELVTIVVRVAAIHRFARLLGAEVPSLGPPQAGEPDRARPEGLAVHHHWVPTVRPADAGPELAWLYGGRGAPNVIRALSAVPGSYREIVPLQHAGYLDPDHRFDIGWSRPGLDRRQVELVAAKTSQVNDCFY